MNAIFRWSITTWSFGASNFLSGITSTYTAMLSADLIPCTLTLPLMSLARPATAKTSVTLTATAPFAAILDRFMSFLSYLICVRLLFPRPIFLEDVVDAGLKRVRTKVKGIACEGIRVRTPIRILIFAHHLDVGAHEDLKAGAEAVPGVVVQGQRTVHEVRMRVHGVVVERSDQPRIKPVIGARGSAREFHRWRRRDGRWCSASDQVVVVMVEHA